MSYATTNPPRLLVPGVSGSPNIWLYASADAHADVDASGYFTNGATDLGMRDGDQMIVIDTNLKITSWHYVEVSGTTVNLADGTVIGSTTNSD